MIKIRIISFVVATALMVSSCGGSKTEASSADRSPSPIAFTWDRDSLFSAMLSQDLILSWGYSGDYIKESAADKFFPGSNGMIQSAGAKVVPAECQPLENLITPAEEMGAEYYTYIENSGAFDKMFIQFTFSFESEDKAKSVIESIRNTSASCGSYKKLKTDGDVLDKTFWKDLVKNEPNLLVSDIQEDQGIAIGRNGSVLWTIFIIDSDNQNIVKTIDQASAEIEKNLNLIQGK